MREGLSVRRVDNGQALADPQPGNNRRFRHDGAQAVQQAQVAVVGRCPGVAPVGQTIGDGDGLQRCPGLNGGLQQGPVKAQYMAAVGGRTFGKDRYMTALGEKGRDLAVDDARMSPAAPTQKNGVVLRGQPAGQGPAADLGL